eukprot:1178132-Amphidinium_carterae.1
MERFPHLLYSTLPNECGAVVRESRVCRWAHNWLGDGRRAHLYERAIAVLTAIESSRSGSLSEERSKATLPLHGARALWQVPRGVTILSSGKNRT